MSKRKQKSEADTVIAVAKVAGTAAVIVAKGAWWTVAQIGGAIADANQAAYRATQGADKKEDRRKWGRANLEGLSNNE